MGFIEAFDKGYKLFVYGLLFQKDIFKFPYSDEDVEVPFNIIQLEDFPKYFLLILLFRLLHHDVFLNGLGVFSGIFFHQVINLVSCDSVIFAQNPRVAILFHVGTV